MGPCPVLPAPQVEGRGAQTARQLRPRQARLLLEADKASREVVGEDIGDLAVLRALSRHGAQSLPQELAWTLSGGSAQAVGHPVRRGSDRSTLPPPVRFPIPGTVRYERSAAPPVLPSLPGFYCQVSIARFLLPGFYCQVSIARFLLPGFYCQVSIARFLLPGFYYTELLSAAPGSRIDVGGPAALTHLAGRGNSLSSTSIALTS